MFVLDVLPIFFLIGGKEKKRKDISLLSIELAKKLFQSLPTFQANNKTKLEER